MQIPESPPISAESKPPRCEVRQVDDKISSQRQLPSPSILKTFQITILSFPPFLPLSRLSFIPLRFHPNHQLTGGCH